MSIPDINEKSAAYLDFTCSDEDDVAETPTTLEYEIYCLTSSAEIRAATSITPAVQSGTITLLPADTTLQSQDNESELRLVTVTADSGLDTQHIRTYKYRAKNLKAIT